jgi:3-phenylpropionate/trans-cinnamate dioxygenase ferredoxin reductase subunit
LLPVLGADLARVFATLHTDHGVTLHTDARVAEIVTTDGRASGVRLADGTVVPADAVVVGIGAAPNTGLAEQAGLAVDNGVLVSAALRSSDPDIYAVGDIANAEHPFIGTRIRVEHWANALNQPAVAAAAMLGNAASYDALPYFYTDQYDLGMEYVGNPGPDGFDRVVVRGDASGLDFTAWWLRGGQVVAGMHVNDWDAIDDVRRIVGRQVDADALADESTALADLAT